MLLSGAYRMARTPGTEPGLGEHDGGKHDLKWLKHAFAIDSPELINPNETQSALVEKLCAEVVRRRLTAPSLFLLEMCRPLNYVSAQFLHFLHPIATVIADTNEYENLTLFLEKRGSIDYICGRLEALEAECGVKKQAGGNRPATKEARLRSPGRHAKD
jgi:hypothetical protein